MANAISIVIHDPTGRQTGETYPPNSTWYWTHSGEAQRKRRSDAGRLKARDKPQLGIENKDVSKQHLPAGERSQEPDAKTSPAPLDSANGLHRVITYK